MTKYTSQKRLIINYATSVWSINSSNTSMNHILAGSIECRPGTSNRITPDVKRRPLASGSQDVEVQEHQELLSAQYLVGCLEEEHTCHNITKVDPPPTQMKETLLTKHHLTIEPLQDAPSKKKSLN